MALTKVTERIISDNLSISGIATASNFKTGTTNVHNVGVEAAGINVLGADTPIGTGSTIWKDGGALFSGIVTATSFVGNTTGNVTGNVTGNISGNVTGNVTGNISGGTVAGSTGTFSSDVTVSGDLGVAGTLTYEDVARVDAVGLSTYREGLHIGPLAGIALTAYKDGSIRSTGIITASSFVGDGSGLTGAGPSLANGVDNRIITATGANALTGEAYLTFNGTGDLTVTGDENTAANLILVSDQSDNTADEWRISSQVDNLLSFANDDSGSFVNKVELHKAGNVTVKQGNLVMGTSGKGIDFSANTDGGGTSSDTILDDYESGTYSTTIVSPNCTLDSDSGTGYYVKVGNMVHVRGQFSLNTNAGSPAASGSDGIVQALPYTPKSGGTNTGTMLQQNINWGGPTSLAHPHYFNPVASGYVCLATSSGIRFYMNKVEYAYERLNNTHLHVGYPGYTLILWNITYETS